MKRLNRRQILDRMAVVTGGMVSLTVLAACDGGVTVPENTANIDLKALSQAHFDLVGDIADMIIPDTDTPGAKSVNVHYLVDELAANWMTEDDKNAFLNELTTLDDRIKAEYGQRFSELDNEKKALVLDQLGGEILSDIKSGEGNHIYLTLREMIIFGYYTSEVGASEELIYDPIPGEYNGCTEFSETGKAYSI